MILLCRTMAAAIAPPGRAELENLQMRVERMEERIDGLDADLDRVSGGDARSKDTYYEVRIGVPDGYPFRMERN